MEDNERLVPYSVNLTKGMYEALKKAAERRQASRMVRDAITMILEGHSEFDSGYNKGLRDAVEIVDNDKMATSISYDGQKIADIINDQLTCLIK